MTFLICLFCLQMLTPVVMLFMFVSVSAPKHTPFCHKNCTSQHHKLLLSLMKCSNYHYGAAHTDTFMKQVSEYVTQFGKFSDVRANADLPDPVASFRYPLVHWVCVLGKFKVLEKLAEMKEFNLGVQSERTGETGLHRMLLLLDRAMVLRKSSVKTILEVFSKTLRTLTDNLPSVITVCNKEGETPFHCLAKAILESTGELEKMNTYEGYFEKLIKELTHLKTSGKLKPEIVRELLLKTTHSQETFLHILACRHGVGHRVIKKVLKNIEPEIMAVLKATKDAVGKTPSDLAEDLCSYEMAAILRPSDQDGVPTDGDGDAVGELPLTPEKSSSLESPDMQSPPATLFHPMEYAMSPFVPDGSTARVQLFSIKKEPGIDETMGEPLRESPVGLNDSPSTSETKENASLFTVRWSPGKASPTPSANEDNDMMASSSAGGSTETITAASDTNHIKTTSSLSIAANDRNTTSSPPTITANYNKTTNSSTSAANHSKATSSPTASANHSKAPSAANAPANHNKSTTSASAASANHNRSTSSPSAAGNHSKNNNGESSIMSGLMTMPQSGKLLNTLHAKFQEQLIQSEKGLGEKEDALVRLRQRITEAREKKQKLLQELEETWNQMIADTREEGVILSEIAAKKRDCEKFKAELAKYEASLKAIRK